MPTDPSRSGLLRWEDLRRLALFTGGGLASQLVSEKLSPAVARSLFALYKQFPGNTLDSLERKMRRALPVEAWPDARAIAEAHALMRVEDMWGCLRGMRTFGWNPQIEWEGLDRLEAPRREGRGVILWSMRFSSATAIKQAFYRAGMPLVHLSRFDHGSKTKTKLGLSVLAPLHNRAENCYLKERVIIPLENSLTYVELLRERLRSGDLVSIFGEHSGRQNFEANVLGTKIELALGAPSLAWLEDAALFTLAPIRVGPLHYRIVIDEPIPVVLQTPRRQFAAAAAQDYADRLNARILKHPADWQGWLYRDF